ncbi:MAG: aromatic ring-hydroxylating dioxygenase subunit alpha [Vicinamibacteria bacterium]|jgi:phenylpropionate dioxygenase-like ring-hydroxylating dioxygenase large terminal subunit|nr:aromatic ring-hydroxylating dioxygenase subunit alpha [Vicinamibacteria bacterium]
MEPAASTAGRLPHLLPPAAYHDPAWARREHERLLKPGWHLVATVPELSQPGDFVTASLPGGAVQVRNFGGELVALSNVCSHRHCLLRDVERGRDPRLDCPYHGWEFGADGRTRTIPDPRSFAPFDRDRDALPRYRLERLGQLLFVCCDPAAPPLATQLGPLAQRVEERFGTGWRLTLRSSWPQAANWKAVVENTLEAYHVAKVHPWTLGSAPMPGTFVEEISAGQTSFATTHFASRDRVQQALVLLERGLLRGLGRGQEARYWHHHVFPNLLFAFTDTLSLATCVTPGAGPGASRLVARQFAPSRPGAGPLALALRAWGWGGARVTARILDEDRRLMPALQKGLEASPHAGVLGAGEQRIHAFQRHVLESVGLE